jgi:hypothetical protein
VNEDRRRRRRRGLLLIIHGQPKYNFLLARLRCNQKEEEEE